jgi:chemotaxis methyl-accepting protein methylase
MKVTVKSISKILLHEHKIDCSKYDDVFLEKSMENRMRELNCSSEDTYSLLFKNNWAERMFFFDSLQISYSEFFRNALTFDVLERIVLPAVLKKKADAGKKQIRIWSAACAGGEETYSLAILLNEMKNRYDGRINFRIFATDQSLERVTFAQQGLYAPSALGNVSFKRMNNWFDKHDNDCFAVKGELKEHIDFSVFDLLSESCVCPPASIFGDFDLVMCANLLFYYKGEFRQKILKKATHCMVEGGYLVTGEIEREILLKNQFVEMYPHSAIFVQ